MADRPSAAPPDSAADLAAALAQFRLYSAVLRLKRVIGLMEAVYLERSQAVWKYLDLLPDEAVADIGTLLLLTPDATKNSFADMEFDEPIPSKL